MNLNCTLEEKISKKSGKPYTVLVVQLTDTCSKQIFLEPAEIELLKMRVSQYTSPQTDLPPFMQN